MQVLHTYLFSDPFSLYQIFEIFLTRENGDATQYQLCALKMAIT